MPSPTQIPGNQITNGSIQRIDLDVTDINTLYPSLTSSRAQHSVFAGPIWSDGPATFRGLVSNDIPAITLANTASYVAGANVNGTVASATNASEIYESIDTNTNANKPLLYSPVGSGNGYTVVTQGNATYNPSTDIITATMFKGTSSCATNATHVTTTPINTNDDYAVALAASNDIDYASSGLFSYNPSTNILSVPSISATRITASLKGNASTATTANNATYADNMYLYVDSANANEPLLFAVAGGTFPGYNTVNKGTATYNPSTDTITATTFNGTATNVTTAKTASYVAGGNVKGAVASATDATNATNAQTASYIVSAQTASYIVSAKTASYVAGANVDGTVTSATNASEIYESIDTNTNANKPLLYSPVGSGNGYTVVTQGNATYNPSTDTITATMFKGTSSWATNAVNGGTQQVTVPSASWVSASNFITTAQTASYVAGANVKGAVASATNTTNIYSDIDTGTDFQPVMFSQFDASYPGYVNVHIGSKLKYQPSTGTLRATASWATNAVNGGSGPAIRSGMYANVGDNQYSRTITFSSAMPNTSYAVVCQTLDNMVNVYFKVIENEKNTTDFTVGFYNMTNMGSPVEFSGAFDWQAIAYN